MKINPRLSVVMITYNHEKYIQKAIEGVLMQKTDFEIELILANDSSSDNTDEVIRDILKPHSNTHWINYIRHEKNIGMMPNFIFAMNQAKGKYIALCDGDDYWTDPYKLQKQVDFLELNGDYQACAHETLILTNNGFLSNKSKKTCYTLNDFFTSSHLNTCSFVFRNNLNFQLRHHNSVAGDIVLFILCAQIGKIYYMSEPMAVYRMTATGVYSSVENKQVYLVEMFNSLKDVFPEYAENFQETIHSKKMHNNLYTLSLKSLLTRETPWEAFKYRFLTLLKQSIQINK